jgi:steroid 5-alpha reductase family enzyme
MISGPSILGIGAVVLIVLFVATWWLSRRLENYSFVDVTWALSFFPVTLVYAILAEGWLPRRVAIALLIGAWSLRLGVYLGRRVMRHHPSEDARYRVLRDRWNGPDLARKFLWFFLAQALLVWLLTLPAWQICQNAHAAWHPLEITGFAVWLVGLIGEAIADRQLERFKAATKGDPLAVCRRGLWSWSRHPNYFFQSLIWWGLFLAALPVAWGWVSILAPLAMLHFLLKVTGVPLTEQLALEKRGERYRDYQRSVSVFIPLPPKP